jgi:serine/threonine protein kinase
LTEDLPAQLAWFRQGSVVAGYRLEAQVGADGMAVVFRARDERLGRLVALKILAPGLASDPAFRRRFIAESRAAAVVDDPHIIPIYEAGEAEGALFIAMRFVQGGDLRHVLAREGALPSARAAEFVSPVASALDAAHAAGLVHRDVKPANILVDVRRGRPDHVYLSDFGVSKVAAASVSLTGAGQFLGTPDFSAPEQIQGRPVDGRADQYALACVAYQLLTGEAPFERDQGMAVLLAHLSEPPPSLTERRPDLPAAADEVLARGMAKIPDKRFGSCADFADALRAALGLAPYDPRGTAPVPAAAPDHPPTVIAAPQPGSAGNGRAAPADPAAAATMDSLPGELAAATPTPAGVADARTADRRSPSVPPVGGQVRSTPSTGDLQGSRRRSRLRQPLMLGAAAALILASGTTALALSGSSHPSMSSSTSPTTAALATPPVATTPLSPTATRTSRRPSTSPTRRPTTRPTTPAPETSSAAPRPTPTHTAPPADQLTVSGSAIEYSCADLGSYGFPSGKPPAVDDTVVNNSSVTIQVDYVGGVGSSLGGFYPMVNPGGNLSVTVSVGVYLVFENKSGACLAVARVTGLGQVTIT